MTQNQPTSLRLYMGEGDRDERHATWLELFFDLVFVVAIAELAHVLHDDLTWGGIGGFAALFVPVWWLWIDFSYYADQFDIERKAQYRLVMLGVMFGIIVLALTIHNALHGGSFEFAAIYTVLRLVIIVLYLQAWRVVPESRELTARYATSFCIAFVFWLVSLITPEPIRFVLWGIALLIEISNGPITYTTIRAVPVQVSHMDERFGLFVIIVLGEAIVAVTTGVSETNWEWRATLTAIGGFITAASLWWFYFERANVAVINWALRSNKRALALSFVYGYSHVLLFGGIVATGVGIQAAIEQATESRLPIEVRAILCGGVAVYLLSLTAVQWASPRALPRPVLIIRLVTGLIYGCLVWLSWFLIPVAIVGLVTAILVSLLCFEFRQLESLMLED